METIIDAIVLENNVIKQFKISPTREKYILIKKKLLNEKRKIIDILKNYQEKGEIKSIFKPKNWLIQKELDVLIEAKRTIDKSVKKLTALYK